MSRPIPRRNHLVAVLTAIAVTVLWSSSWVLVRVGLEDEQLEPITFAGLRYGFASLVLIVSVTTKRTRRADLGRLDRGSVGWLAVLGVVFYALTQGAQFVAIDNQPAATTSLMLSLTPLFVGIAGARSLGEHTTSRQFGGAVVIAAGAAVYFAGDLGATTVGITATTVALGANVCGALLGRHINRALTTSPLVITTVSMTIGAVVLITAGLIIDGLPAVTFRAGLIIGWLAVINTAVAFTLWNWSLRRLSAVESAGINNTMLIQIALLAWVFLGETPGAFSITGIAAVSIGVFLTQHHRRSPRHHRFDDPASGRSDVVREP